MLIVSGNTFWIKYTYSYSKARLNWYRKIYPPKKGIVFNASNGMKLVVKLGSIDGVMEAW